MVYVLMSIWYMCLCVHLRLPYDCVMIVALLIPACLFYLTRTLGRNRHAICGSPMIVIHTYIHTYNQWCPLPQTKTLPETGRGTPQTDRGPFQTDRDTPQIDMGPP